MFLHARRPLRSTHARVTLSVDQNREGEDEVTQIVSSIDKNADEFRANAAGMQALVEELKQRRAEAAAGGPPRARERHVARGKLLPRDRVMTLIDPGAPFLELSPLAA